MKVIIGLIVLWPLVGFLFNGLGRNNWSKKVIATTATGFILGSFIFIQNKISISDHGHTQKILLACVPYCTPPSVILLDELHLQSVKVY